MRYPTLDTINATTDPTNLLVYANTLTNGKFVPFVLGAFWFIALVGSYLAQMRFTNRPKISTSWTVASFVTFGLTVLFSLKSGLISNIYIVAFIALTVVGFAWASFSNENSL